MIGRSSVNLTDILENYYFGRRKNIIICGYQYFSTYFNDRFCFHFCGPLTVGLAVADTIGTFVDITDTAIMHVQALIIAALLAAITYNLIAWKLGLPSSSSNSLAGGLVGAELFVVEAARSTGRGLDTLHQGHLEGS